MPKPRPNPEKLLQRAQEEERRQKRGKLKIYLGAAPGVGKTYTMLEEAHAKRGQGLDVIIGVVESHGRQEIELLLEDIPILSPRIVDYRGQKLSEFNLDDALVRQPALILMDEMAHTNAPGSRHAKRWQDIKELLDRGIDVYTTLNVQHIESLNDAVTQILHTQVKETIPDSMLELAEKIELIDLPPEDLLKRLQEGKIYIPEQAAFAEQHFFRKGNLSALRELALRIMAEQVETQVMLYRQDQGIKHIWPTKERLLVCVSAHYRSTRLIRTAKRMAARLKAQWFAVYVDTPELKISPEKRNSAIYNLRLAERLGAVTMLLTGLNVSQEIMNYAHEHNITRIVIGKKNQSRWRDILFGNLADKIIRASGEIDVYLITGELDSHPLTAENLEKLTPWRLYIIASLISLGAAGLDYFLSDNNLSAYFNGVLVFLLAQIIIYLTIISKRQANAMRLAKRHTDALYALTRQLAATRGVNQLLEIAAHYIAEVFDTEVMALVPENNRLIIQAKSAKELILNEKEEGVAQWVYDLGQAAGLGTDTLPFADAIYLPLLASQEKIGVLRVKPVQPNRLLTPEEMHLLESCVSQIALAIEVDKAHVVST